MTTAGVLLYLAALLSFAAILTRLHYKYLCPMKPHTIIIQQYGSNRQKKITIDARNKEHAEEKLRDMNTYPKNEWFIVNIIPG